jgi:hypothetical protein
MVADIMDVSTGRRRTVIAVLSSTAAMVDGYDL